jgi:hypothetical protein
MVTSYLSPAEADEVQAEFRNLGATVAELNDHPTVTFVRQGGTQIGPVSCISVSLNRQQPGGEGAVATEAMTQTGRVRAFVTAIPAPVQQGDRFRWNGQRCLVTASPITKNGMVRIPFRLESTNRTGL